MDGKDIKSPSTVTQTMLVNKGTMNAAAIKLSQFIMSNIFSYFLIRPTRQTDPLGLNRGLRYS